MEDIPSLTGKRKRDQTDDVPSAEELNRYLAKIIEGQEDITEPPEMATRNVRETLSTLNDQIMRLIEAKEEKQRERQRKEAEAMSAEMASAEKEQITAENLAMMNDINNLMAKTNEKLTRTQRIALNRKIMTLLNDVITTVETSEQLEQETSPIKQNVKGLFNAVIQYYTEMASYGYNHTPEVLAKIGSMIAGATMIGSAISMSHARDQAGVLIALSGYIGTATVTASGLYFLQRAGLPVSDMLQKIGSNTMQCLKSGCTTISSTVKTELTKIGRQTMNALGEVLFAHFDYFTFDWIPQDDTITINTSDISLDSIFANAPSTVRTSTSTASEAGQSIAQILEVPPEQQLQEVIQGTTNENVNIGDMNIDFNETQNSNVSGLTQTQDIDLYGDLDFDGGRRRRKTRRTKRSYRTRRHKKHKKRRSVKRRHRKRRITMKTN